MIWDYIRDFIVQYITGGYDSLGNGYFVSAGFIHSVDMSTGQIDESYSGDFNSFIYKIDDTIDGYSNFIGMSDWLATTITIICMCLIVVFAIWLVRWVFKVVSSAMLLK